MERALAATKTAVEASARQTVEITLKDFSFTPGKLQVEAGKELEIRLTNPGDAPHTFTIEEFDVDAELQSRAETTVLVTPAEAGRFTYYCRFHQAQQMGAPSPSAIKARSPFLLPLPSHPTTRTTATDPRRPDLQATALRSRPTRAPRAIIAEI